MRGSVIRQSGTWSGTSRVCALPYEEFGTSPEGIREIINNCDVKAARQMVTTNKTLWERLLHRLSWGANPRAVSAVFESVAGGVESLFPDYRKIEKNWDLDGQWNHHTNGMVDSWNAHCNRLPKPKQVAATK
jgi:hypothetical protein